MKERLFYVFLGALMSIAFILLTAYFANNGTSTISTISFNFHLIPFALGYNGASIFLVSAYYLLLWIALTLIFAVLFKILKNCYLMYRHANDTL